MAFDLSIFPSKPVYHGKWWAISFEPIVGSGERINAIVVAKGDDGRHDVIQSIRDDVLDALYGIKSDGIKDMLSWVRQSIISHITDNNDVDSWASPISGFKVSKSAQALDDNLSGIFRQAIRLSASLGTLSLEAERDEEDEQVGQKQTEQWATRIFDESKILNPALNGYFGSRVRLSGVNVHTKFGFYNDIYASNFGLIVPSRLSASINTIKAKVYDLESLKKSSMVLKPETVDIIVGIPSFDDPTIPQKTVEKMRSHQDEMTELASKEGINFIPVHSAKQAAERIALKAA
ncbi:hypothetical protein ACLEXA_11755 [Pseudescherichia vulneris]|jgi:hypothetical protein